MLYAFKCKQMPNFGDDPDISKLMPLHKNYDSSQLTALSALLNKNRPIVAVHGAAGTGKTLLLAQYLDIILKSDEYKNMPIAVISPSTSSLYRIIDFYCSIASKEILKEIPFIIMREFDSSASIFSLKNPNVQQLVKLASFQNFKRIYSEEVLNICEELDFKKSKDGLRSQKISSLIQHMQSLKHNELYDFIQKRRIVFLTFSPTKFQLLERIGIKFGGVIIDNAERINESESWQTILKTSSFVRLFGDYHQFIKPSSIEQLKLNYNKSLLQKLDEDFGDSNVNFHLNRQYTANSTIRAWGDSVLYKEKKAIPADKYVEEMNLNEILMPNLKNKTPKLITEPLVLVDTSKLEGEWKESMFETEKVDTFGSKYDYQNYRNWGMALIAAQHINLLLQNGINPNEIAHPLSSVPHHRISYEIFGTLWPYNVNKFIRIFTSHQSRLCGTHFSVNIRAFLDNQFVFQENDYQRLLASLNFTLSRANRQFMLISDIKNLENNCVPKLKEMLECFRSTGGIIVGPNDIFPLKNGQFEEIKNLVKKKLKMFK
uniref:AAA_11 domain-containing protein n=1 Tax=Meloidogyne hapla TaxID=6305 RepID=A0A1I8BPW4_MELHA